MEKRQEKAIVNLIVVKTKYLEEIKQLTKEDQLKIAQEFEDYANEIRNLTTSKQ